MTTVDRRALAAWNARNRRARDEYRAHPLTHLPIAGPCLGCGASTRYLSGYCRDCAKEDA